MSGRKSGFEDAPVHGGYAVCRHPEHNPPDALYVPVGKIYRHICARCGRESILYPSTTTHENVPLIPNLERVTDSRIEQEEKAARQRHRWFDFFRKDNSNHEHTS